MPLCPARFGVFFALGTPNLSQEGLFNELHFWMRCVGPLIGWIVKRGVLEVQKRLQYTGVILGFCYSGKLWSFVIPINVPFTICSVFCTSLVRNGLVRRTSPSQDSLGEAARTLRPQASSCGAKSSLWGKKMAKRYEENSMKPFKISACTKRIQSELIMRQILQALLITYLWHNFFCRPTFADFKPFAFVLALTATLNLGNKQLA